MKKAFITIFTLMITVVSFGQIGYENFKVIKNDLIWQKVYDTDINHKDLETYFKSLPFTSQIKNNDGVYVGISPKTVMETIHGKNPITTQPYTGFIKIEMKDNRYRVTIRDIKFDSFQINFYGGGASVGGSDDQTSTLEKSVVKDGKIKNSKRMKRVLANLNHDFDKIFTIIEKTSDDW